MVFRLSGTFTSPEVQELKAEIADAGDCVAVDLEEIALVDLDAVDFLAAAEERGIELRHVPQYIREWILLERASVAELRR